MIRRRLWTSLLGVVLAAVIGLIANFATRNEPVLGLDLQGGVSVVLAPKERASHDDLLTIRDLIRDELEDRGIAEPDVRVEGEKVVVDLPGVRDQRAALSAVDVAGIVTVRPVVSPCAEVVDEAANSAPDSAAADSEPADSSAPGSAPIDTELAPDATGGPVGADDGDIAGTGGEVASPSDSSADDSTPHDSTVGESAAPDESGADDSAPTESEPLPLGPIGVPEYEAGDPSPFTPPPPPDTDTTATLRLRTDDSVDAECTVGPVQRGPAGELTGFLFPRDSAEAVLNGGAWVVNVGLTSAGSNAFNQLATSCLNRDPSACPTGQIAIVMDNVVQSAPAVNSADFTDGVSITGQFTESEARDLARVLNRGAFPIEVRAENVQTVSATLGKDSLQASILAGFVGILLVLALLFYFYRRLIVVVLGGAAVWGMLIYSIAAIVSQTTNYALTLAGVAGIVVSIGVTVDSYVVYFERLKDEVRHGRSIRNSAVRSFKATWRTIIAADLVSVLAALVLFTLSVGSVRGFALYLGITTVCDVIVCYFFTRPAVVLLADKGWLDEGDTFGLKNYD